jgi:hypothetical protein
MKNETFPVELEQLAMAGYFFEALDKETPLHIPRGLPSEVYNKDRIRYAQSPTSLPRLIANMNIYGPFIIGPEDQKILLLHRDLFNILETTDISQTAIPGVIQIITQHLPIKQSRNYNPKTYFPGRDNAGYIIHMMPETMPENIKWNSIDLKTYSHIRHEKYRG